MGERFGHIFYWTGVGLYVAVGIAAVITLLCVVIAFWFSKYGPMLHWGAPELEGELAFYSRQRIIAAKGGGIIPPEQRQRRLDHAFKIPWFIGVSTRKGHFLLGFIRLRRMP